MDPIAERLDESQAFMDSNITFDTLNVRDVRFYRQNPSTAVHLTYRNIGAYAALLPRDDGITSAFSLPNVHNSAAIAKRLGPCNEAQTAERIAAYTNEVSATPGTCGACGAM